LGQVWDSPRAHVQGCIELLKRYNIPIDGKRAVVIGRSNIVGIPVAHLLLSENATVTVCHSRTADIAATVREVRVSGIALCHPACHDCC